MEFSTNCFRISSGSELVQYMSSDANQSLTVSRGISEESVEMKYASLVHVWVGMGGVELAIFLLDLARKIDVDKLMMEIQLLIDARLL